MNVKDFSV